MDRRMKPGVQSEPLSGSVASQNVNQVGAGLVVGDYNDQAQEGEPAFLKTPDLKGKKKKQLMNGMQASAGSGYT